MKNLALLILALLVAGCNAAGAPIEELLTCPGCALREETIWLAPEPELRANFEAAIARWERAGLTPGRLGLSEHGAPAIFIEGPALPKEATQAQTRCGTTLLGHDLIDIKVQRNSVWARQFIVDHELCHVLGFVEHTADGLCGPGSNIISEASLSAVCDADSQNCAGFQLETTPQLEFAE